MAKGKSPGEATPRATKARATHTKTKTGVAQRTPEAETAKGRVTKTGTARQTGAVPTPESELAKGRVIQPGAKPPAGKIAAARALAKAAALSKAVAKAPAKAAGKAKAATRGAAKAGASAKAAGKTSSKAAAPARAPAKAASTAKPAGKASTKAASSARTTGKVPAKAASTTKTTGKAPAKAASPAKTTARRGSMPLAPEAMPRVRKALDRPAPVRKRQTRAPRDRSQARPSGLQELGWQQVADEARKLARQIAPRWSPELVVGLAKGGVFVGEAVASALQIPFFPVRIGKRSRDVGVRSPDASDILPADMAGRRVLVVDDIAGSGSTLQAALEASTEAGAAEVRTATLVVREGGWQPDFFAVETSDLVVLPWDYEPSPGAVGSAEPVPADDAADDEGLDRFGA